MESTSNSAFRATCRALLFATLTLALFLSACKEVSRGEEKSDQSEEPGQGKSLKKEVVAATDFPCFLAISDVHLDANVGSIYVSPDGKDIGDTDTTLWNFTKTRVKQVIAQDKPKFAIYLGDLPAHDQSSNPDDNHRKDLATVLKDLREIATDADIPLLYVPGNNDGIEGDYAPFTSKSDSTPFDLDAGHAHEWPMILPSKTSGPAAPRVINEDHLGLGFYSAYPLGEAAGLRAICMNTVIFNNTSWQTIYPLAQMTADARTQMAWLEAELDSAAHKHEAVMLLMHIPPGLDGYGTKHAQETLTHDAPQPMITYKYMWRDLKLESGELVLNKFIDLIRNPKYTISSIFYSHTHEDELRLVWDNSGKKVLHALVSLPGITPGHHNNPGFKTVTYDPKRDFAPVDFHTYYSSYFPKHQVQAYSPSNVYTFREAYHYAGTGTLLEGIRSIGAPDPTIGVDTSAVYRGLSQTFSVKHDTSFVDWGTRQAVTVDKAAQTTGTGSN